MRKIFISILLTAIAAGCSNQATKTASEPATAKPTALSSKMHGPTAPQALDPLLDPANPLAKRAIYFDFDSSELSDADRALLKVHTQYLMEHAATKIEVEGNTDERGSAEYNVGLGERRAVVVKKFLVASGVSDDRVAVVSYGKEKPVATCHEESCWKQNRRAFIKY